MNAVFVVMTEWNRPHDSDGGSTLEGVYDNEVAARRASWAAMREYIGFGHAVFGRRNDSEWDCDVTIERIEVRPEARAKVSATPACETCRAALRRKRCWCRGKVVA